MLSLLISIVLTQTPYNNDIGFIPRPSTDVIEGSIPEQELPRGTVIAPPNNKPFTILFPTMILARETVEMALGWRDERDECLLSLEAKETALCDECGGGATGLSFWDVAPWVGAGLAVVAAGSLGAWGAYEATKPRLQP
jgi:hypothetical protein